MLTSLLGGDLQFLFIDPPPALPHVRTGRLRALAVTSANRVPYLPDVPTVSEAAVPGYSAMFWVGLFAPSSTPRPIVSQVQQEVSRIVRSAAGQERFSALGISPVGNTPDEFLSYLKAESIRYAPVIRATGIRAE